VRRQWYSRALGSALGLAGYTRTYRLPKVLGSALGLGFAKCYRGTTRGVPVISRQLSTRNNNNINNIIINNNNNNNKSFTLFSMESYGFAYRIIDGRTGGAHFSIFAPSGEDSIRKWCFGHGFTPFSSWLGVGIIGICL